MNKEEYEEYKQDIAVFFKREGIVNLSVIDNQSEVHFTWRPCEVCERPLGGDRFDCNGWNPELKEVRGPYEVCTDCVYFAEYGQLDDMTMLEMEGK